MLSLPLNGSFLGAAQTNSGGRIALGGALTSLNPVPTTEYLFGGSAGFPADAQLWLGFLASPASRPSFVGGTPTCLGNNQFQFAVSGTTGTTNEIQGSFDFQNWDFICDLVMTNSTSSFFYINNTVVPYRFFRAEQLQSRRGQVMPGLVESFDDSAAAHFRRACGTLITVSARPINGRAGDRCSVVPASVSAVMRVPRVFTAMSWA
jgi:hypothetical protein